MCFRGERAEPGEVLKSMGNGSELGGTCEPAEGALQVNRLARKIEWPRLKKVCNDCLRAETKLASQPRPCSNCEQVCGGGQTARLSNSGYLLRVKKT